MTSPSSARSRGRLLRVCAAALLGLAITSCFYKPRWTPEKVAPPASLESAVREAIRAAESKRAEMPPDQATTLAVTRDGAILTALARNRSLAVQRFGPDISAQSIQEARAAFDPNLLATVSYGRDKTPNSRKAFDGLSANVTKTGDATFNVTEFLPTGTEVFLSGGVSRTKTNNQNWSSLGNWSAGVNQSLLRGFGPDVNLVTLRQAENTAARNQHELRGFVLDIVQQVETAYWELALANATLEIRLFSVSLAQEQLQLNFDLISVGKISKDVIITAEAELASRQADLVDAKAAVRARVIDLVRLLDPDRASQWAVNFDLIDAPEAGRVDLNPEISAQLAMAYKPELAQSRLDLANSDLEIVRTRNGLLPKLDAFGSYGRMRSGDTIGDAIRGMDNGEYNNYQVGMNFEMAPLNRAERARYRRAQFQQSQAEAAIRNFEQLLESQVRQATLEAERQWERIQATQKVVKSRQDELAVEKDRFFVGKATNLDNMIVQRDLIQAQIDEVTARVRYIEAVTRLYFSEGTLLDRRGVGAQTKEMEKKP
ncbi:MAG: TolC family protein [Candidatus Sumerlaeota bacterium]|nr:TolC family protein [Candidatus Sumerlaeota bacterium]